MSYVGIDLGGTKIAAALTDATGEQFVRKITRATETSKGQSRVLANLFAVVDELLAEKAAVATVQSMGIGIPGVVKAGVLVKAPNLACCENLNLSQLLSNRYGKPVFGENDANAAAIGELLFGAGKGLRDFLYLTISTGIGGGIVLNGKLYHGHAGVAGEIGHTIIIPDGPLCGCGQRGCLEACASGTHLAHRLRERIQTEQPKTLMVKLAGGDPSAVTTHHLNDAIQQGDAFALEILDEEARMLALGISNYIHILDPEVIVMGGGLANLGAPLFERINAQIRQINHNHGAPLPSVVRSTLTHEPGLLGAVALAIEGVFG